MKRSTKSQASFRLAIVLGVLVFGGVAALAAPSVKFSHKKHVDEASCKDCHTKSAKGYAIPSGTKCVDCHDEAAGHGPKDFYKQAKKDCKICHVGKIRPYASRTYKSGRVKDVHGIHDNDCTDCHAKGKTSTKSRDSLYPKAKTCFACHKENDSGPQKHTGNACTKCHDLHR